MRIFRFLGLVIAAIAKATYKSLYLNGYTMLAFLVLCTLISIAITYKVAGEGAVSSMFFAGPLFGMIFLLALYATVEFLVPGGIKLYRYTLTQLKEIWEESGKR